MAKPKNRGAVLSYSEAHPDEVSYLSARALGERCGVSESTVIRAVQELGFRGYPDYQEQVRRRLSHRRTTVERFSAAHGSDPFARTFARDLENLKLTWEGLSRPAMDRAARLLSEAERVWLLGLRSSYSVAVLLHQGLSFLEVDARPLLPGYGDLWDDASALGKRDTLVAIALPRYTRLTIEAARVAHDRGARVVAITDGPSSPLAGLADVLLPVAYGLSGYVESFTAAVCLAQALLLAVAENKGARGLEALRRKEELWADWKVYWES
jgi:DNA-binding MurR/RpiR family transcriptional regulator